MKFEVDLVNEIISQLTNQFWVLWFSVLSPFSQQLPFLNLDVPPHRWLLYQSVVVERGQVYCFQLQPT